MTGPGNMRRKSLDPNSFVSRKEAMGLAQYYAGQAGQAAANDVKAIKDRIEEVRVEAQRDSDFLNRKLWGIEDRLNRPWWKIWR